MNHSAATRQRRETILLVVLSVLCGAGAFCYLLLIGDTWFLGMLAVVAAFIMLGVVNYVLWGSRFARRRNASFHRGRGALPDAIRERLNRNVICNDEDRPDQNFPWN